MGAPPPIKAITFDDAEIAYPRDIPVAIAGGKNITVRHDDITAVQWKGDYEIAYVFLRNGMVLRVTFDRDDGGHFAAAFDEGFVGG